MRRSGLLIFVVAAFLLVALGSVRAAASSRLPFHLGRATHAYALTAGPGESIWFIAEPVEGEGLTLGRVSETGKVSEVPLDAGPPPIPAIVSSPQGDLWFGEEHAIGRRTPEGDLRSYALPVGSGSPTAMTIGPEGDLWFTDTERSGVGHLTPTGEVVEFHLPSGRRPNGIATGSDGNLWVTDPIGGTVDRITPAGVVDEFTVSFSHLDSIAAGPDGNLWFGEESASAVGRITPDGSVTKFPVPTSSGTRGIIAGPGGLLYFLSGAEVGAISPDGTVSWPACPVGCRVGTTALALGSEGRLWVASGQVDCEGFCGGDRPFELERQPGTVRPYTLPPLKIGIGPRLSRLRGDRTKVLLACGLQAGCDGVVRLGYYVSRGGGSKFRTLAKAPFELQQGERRRVVLRLRQADAARLAEEAPTHLLVRAEGGRGAFALRGLDLHD